MDQDHSQAPGLLHTFSPQLLLEIAGVEVGSQHLPTPASNAQSSSDLPASFTPIPGQPSGDRGPSQLGFGVTGD